MHQIHMTSANTIHALTYQHDAWTTTIIAFVVATLVMTGLIAISRRDLLSQTMLAKIAVGLCILAPSALFAYEMGSNDVTNNSSSHYIHDTVIEEHEEPFHTEVKYVTDEQINTALKDAFGLTPRHVDDDQFDYSTMTNTSETYVDCDMTTKTSSDGSTYTITSVTCSPSNPVTFNPKK